MRWTRRWGAAVGMAVLIGGSAAGNAPSRAGPGGGVGTAPAGVRSAPLAFPALRGFVANEGQAEERVLFQARGAEGAVSLTRRGAVFASPRRGWVTALEFEGANERPVVDSESPEPGVVNDLRGGDPARWRGGLRRFSRVVYREVWPGVDARFLLDGPRV